MKSIKSDVDAGYGYNANVALATLLMSAKQLYTNISRQNEWSKVDPRDAQILALTTELRSSPVSNHTDLEDITVQYMAVPKKRQSQAWTIWKSGGKSTKVPLWWKMWLIITGASTMSKRVDMMVYITIITLRPRMRNGLQRNKEDERQRLQVQFQRHPHQQWGPI